MDELTKMEVGDAGALPEALRTRVRRRQVVHRARVGGGILCVLMVAAVGVLVGRPGGQSQHDSWQNNAVITIDDPMFDALDEGYRNNRVDTRWRAGARLDGDWVLEM